MSTISGYTSNNYDSVLEALDNFNATNNTNATTTGTSTSSSSTLSTLYNNTVSTTSGLSESAISYLTDIKSAASSMQSVLSKIFGSSTLKATSSNTDALTVSGSSSSAKSMEVQVGQIAAKQVNEGTSLDSKASDISEGTYDFTISLDNGKEKKFSVSVNEGDTNEDVQKKVASAINKDTSAGISASVVYNEDGTSSLKMESKNTGTNSAFKVTGDLADKLGMDNTTQEAQNAKYSVDGKVYYSQSNDVDLGNGMKATLKAASKETVTVSYEQDKESMTNAVKELVESYNSLLSAAGSGDNAGATKLANQLKSLVETYGSSLKNIGIEAGSDGKLTINEKKLSEAAENGTLSSFMKANADGKSNYGFVNRLDRLANDISKDPSKFYKETKSSSTSDVAGIDRDFTLSDFSFGQLSLLNKYDTVGMLFDMFA